MSAYPGDPYQQGPPQYSMPPPPISGPPRKSKAPLIIGIVVGVLVLCCGGGSLVAYLSGGSTGGSSASASGNSNDVGAASASPTDESVNGDLDQFHTGDCLLVSKSGDVSPTSCTTKGAYKVYLRENGTISDSYCRKTDATTSLYEDVEGGTSEDFVLCIGPVSGQ